MEASLQNNSWTTIDNSSDCLVFNFSETEDDINFYASFSSNLLGCLSSVVAIVFVVVTRAYRLPVNRLILYLSVDTLLYTVVTPFVYVVDGPSVLSKIIIFWSEYFHVLYSIFVCWIGIYIFALVVLKVKLKRARYEVIGILIVLVIPLTFVWTVPVYEGSEECVYNSNYVKFLLYGLGPPCLLSLLTAAVTITFYVGVLCKDFCKTKTVHVKPFTKLMPFILFIFIQNSFLIVAFSIIVLMMNFKQSLALVYVFQGMSVLNFVSIPFLLLCQLKIRRKLVFVIGCCFRCRLWKHKKSKQNHHCQHGVIQSYATTSHMESSAQSVTSFTDFEKGVLIVKQ